MILGIGELSATRTPGDCLKTLALGSCVGIVAVDLYTKTVGMVHIALPDSKINTDYKPLKAGYYADTAVPALLAAMRDAGSITPVRDLRFKLAGGANVLEAGVIFDIGNRNIRAIREIFATIGLRSVAEDIGGNISRTLTIDVDTGTLLISCPGVGTWKI